MVTLTKVLKREATETLARVNPLNRPDYAGYCPSRNEQLSLWTLSLKGPFSLIILNFKSQKDSDETFSCQYEVVILRLSIFNWANVDNMKILL